jgi:molybdopterin biosynthesis enzyme
VGFRTFIRGCLSVSDQGHLQVQPLSGNESHRVANLATCNAWLHVTGDHAAGSLIEVSPLLANTWRLTA